MTTPNALEAEEALCRKIAERTGAPPEKVKRVRALARGRAVTFHDEQEYMDAVWFKFERPELENDEKGHIGEW